MHYNTDAFDFVLPLITLPFSLPFIVHLVPCCFLVFFSRLMFFPLSKDLATFQTFPPPAGSSQTALHFLTPFALKSLHLPTENLVNIYTLYNQAEMQ